MLAITILSGSSGECVTSPGNTGLDLFGQREIPSEHLAQMIQHQLGRCLRRVVAACGSKTADSSGGRIPGVGQDRPSRTAQVGTDGTVLEDCGQKPVVLKPAHTTGRKGVLNS